MDLITVGITCYNAARHVERAVRAAQQQGWPSLEIVVVDDASTDGSWEVVERLARGDGRIRAVRHGRNLGVGAARASVLERAAGAFVAFFDDDDTSDPRRLAEQHRRIVAYETETGEGTVVSYTATTQVYPDGTTRYSPTLGMDATPAPAGDDVARLILLGTPAAGDTGACPTCSLMARREVYERAGGFDPAFRRQEDTDFNVRVALAGGHFAGLAEPLVVQTMTFTRDKSVDEERRSAYRLIEKHADLLRDWGWYDFVRRWTELKYSLLAGSAARALPHAATLLLRSPGKLARKAWWALPNRRSYKRFQHAHGRS